VDRARTVDQDASSLRPDWLPPLHRVVWLGMQERISALGGRLEAGPRSGGGFRVFATIPLDGTV
jgi:glucose-6-phosphate-specific signal transduction histidine kinase